MMIGNVKFSFVENMIELCFVVLIVGYLLWLVRAELKKRGQKVVKEVQAKVLSKFEVNYYNQKAYVQNGAGELGLAENGKLYKILFEEVDGKNQKHEVMVSKTLYDRIEEGSAAKICYKGDILLQFGDFKNTVEEDSAFVGVNQEFK